MDLASLLAAAHAESAARLVLAEGPAILPSVLVGDAPRLDLVAGQILGALVAVGRARSTLAIVDAWLGAQHHRVPRRYGGTDVRTQIASAFLAARAGDAMLALFANPPANFTGREEFLLVFLWRQFFLNPFAAIHGATERDEAIDERSPILAGHAGATWYARPTRSTSR